jgi:hypothetical protein
MLVSSLGRALIVLFFLSIGALAQNTSVGVSQQDRVANELLVKFSAQVSESRARETIQRLGAQIVGAPMLSGSVFHIRFTNSQSSSDIRTALEKTDGVEYTEPVYTVRAQTPR